MATQEEIKNMFGEMMNSFRPDKASGENATFQFDLSGDNGGMYWVKVDDGQATHGEGETDADVTVKANADDFYQIATGDMNPMQAFMMGKIKIDNMNMGMKLMQWFNMGG
jgi:putative sterol carrier protein